MSRPTKQGLEYFPIDVQFDEKIEMLIAEKGSNALSTLITIWQLIYQNNGYYVDNGEDLFLLVKRRIMIDVSEIKAIVDSALKRGIFDEKLHREYKILTSRGIQKRYFIAASRKKIVNVYKNYLLVEVIDYNNVSLVGLNDCNNATKEKEKEKVEEEVEVKVEVKEKLKEDVFTYFLNRQYPEEEAEEFYNHYEAQGWVTGNGIPISNWKVKAENWHKKEMQKKLKLDGFQNKFKGVEYGDFSDESISKGKYAEHYQ